jgi:hypothetical protein
MRKKNFRRCLPRLRHFNEEMIAAAQRNSAPGQFEFRLFV